MNDKVLYEFPESKVLYSTGKGVTLVIYDGDEYGPHSCGDRWIVWFYEHQVDVKVNAVESSTGSKEIGLCFGYQFCDEEIRQMMTGRVWFTKIK